MTDSNAKTDHKTCAYCYMFNPCPCGECCYGVCGNTKSQRLHEFVHEDAKACGEQITDRGLVDDR